MRMVLDTNVLVSALINWGGLPDQLLQRWESDEFTLVTSAEQFDELQRVLTYEKLQRFIRPEQATRLVASLRHSATFAEQLPLVDASTDISDNVILATAMAGNASHLVTGDRGHLLSLKQVGGVFIITVREAIDLIASQPRST